MFSNLQSFLEYIFGSNIYAICCMFVIIHIILETVFMFKKGGKNND